MDPSPLAGGPGVRRGSAGWPPATPRGPVRGRSLGLLQDVKRTIGRIHGGWVHAQSQAGGFDSCLSQPATCPPSKRGGLLIQWVAALDPGGRAAVDVADRRVAQVQQVAGRRQATLAAMADSQDGPIARDFVEALLQLPERDQLSAGDVTVLIFPRF